MESQRRKEIGAYYTPDTVVRSLVSWAATSPNDRMLDPSCGDGRFLAAHPKGVGVEGDPHAAAVVHSRVPGSLIHQGDFFAWAANTEERFDCAAGNPPFIRYQRFRGAVRESAQRICARHGAVFTSLSSSWAPFLVATATLLKPGGRMAFVVPAEIGHAPYAVPLLRYLLANFERIQVIPVARKLFPELSEDCWLLYCQGFGGQSQTIHLNPTQDFHASKHPPKPGRAINVIEWETWGNRLRPFLLSTNAQDLYQALADSRATFRLSEKARVSIGYVTGANDFFHLKPSMAKRLGIPNSFLLSAVRNGRDLVGASIDDATVREWWLTDKAHLLLRLKSDQNVPKAVRTYLDSAEGIRARDTYKCRNRRPWYVVPDVRVPDAFLSYMSGQSPMLVANPAGCVATNSVHVVRMKPGANIRQMQTCWDSPLTRLSCELEGHPLGGGMLKLEPREAGRVLIPHRVKCNRKDVQELTDAVHTMRRWRHYGEEA